MVCEASPRALLDANTLLENVDVVFGFDMRQIMGNDNRRLSLSPLFDSLKDETAPNYVESRCCFIWKVVVSE